MRFVITGVILSKIKQGILVLILLIVSLGLAGQTWARHAQVLGVSAQEKTPDLPLSQGPGLLLPTSPLYFLDLWRDNLSLILASFDQETKAKLHLKIAAERIVEVKLMLEGKNVNLTGLDTALANIAQNIEGAKISLKHERAKGRSVEKLALELNQSIDHQQETLRIVSRIGDTRIKLKIRALEADIEDDEAEIEDELSEDELENEIEEELEEEIGKEVGQASESARKVERLVERLNEEATKSTQRALRKREEAVRRAIEEQNKEKQKLEEQRKKEEERKQEKLTKTQEKLSETARKAVKEAQKAAEDLMKAQEEKTEIKTSEEDED